MPYGGGTIHWLGSPRPSRLPRLEMPDKKALEAVADSVRDERGVLFSGDVGAGKTTLAAYCDLWLALNDDDRKPPEAYWTTTEAYLEDVRESFNYAKRFEDWGDRFSAEGVARKCSRLFLDDLGTERPTEFALEQIAALIDARYTRRLPLWVTTNLELEAIAERYGRRTLSRLSELCIVVRMRGTDRRVTH